MSFDFPSSPADNQQYVAANGYVYTYKTATGAWLMTGTGGSVGPTGPQGPPGPQGTPGQTGGMGVWMSDTAPVDPVTGILWWNSTTGNLFTFYNDGDSSQWVQISGGVLQPALPTTLLPAPPPNDDCDYVLTNNVWRLRSQTFDMSGKSQQDVTVPTWGPGHARASFHLINATGVQFGLGLRTSLDGATFPATLNDYYNSGFYHGSGSTGYQNVPWAGATLINLTANNDHNTIPNTGEVVIQLTRGAAGANFGSRVLSHGYNNSAVYNLMSYCLEGIMWAWAGSANLKTLRFLTTTGNVYAAGSKLTVEWLP
jgi:hypothetical protein